MSDNFRKFIETGGRSLDEIRKTINDMVNKKLDPDGSGDVELPPRDGGSGDQPVYTAQKIPPRPDSVTLNMKKPLSNGTPFSDEELAEMRAQAMAQPLPRYEHPNSIGYPHEPIPENMNEQDEYMLDKIREMRSLEEISHKSYIVKQCAQVTLVRQGEFMADVEDDFGRRAFCALPHPIYAAMSNSQLRTYFTWRTDVRRGVYNEIEKAYVLMYCYELLNKIGVSSSGDAFDRLVDLWENCGKNVGLNDELMPRWIKDFYAYNNIARPLPEALVNLSLSAENTVAMELEAGNYADKFNFLADNSAYDIRSSVFLSEETEPLMNGACEAVLGELAVFLGKHGAELTPLICGRMRKDFSWEPFARSIVDVERMDGFRSVVISPLERYTVKRGQPTLERFEFTPHKGVIGYILKSIEAQLRSITGFKRRITPNIRMLENDIANRSKLEAAAADPEFSKLIPRAVERYCAERGIYPERPSRSPRRRAAVEAEETSYVREKVEIDVSKLGDIRAQADANARRLIIDEYDAPPDDNLVSEPEARDDGYDTIAGQISDDDFAERIAEYSELADEDANAADDSALYAEADQRDPRFSALSDEWQELAMSLTPDNIMLLRSMLGGTVQEFCRERDILPQTMFEEINEEALNAIDDVLIEGGVILDDYIEEVRALVDAFPK